MTQQAEWRSFVALWEKGTPRVKLLKAARAMADAGNRGAALRFLGVTTAKEKREIKARWRAIRATTDAEARRHCQFDGLPDVRTLPVRGPRQN